MKYRYYLITIHYTSYTNDIEERMVSLRWRYICTLLILKNLATNSLFGVSFKKRPSTNPAMTPAQINNV